MKTTTIAKFENFRASAQLLEIVPNEHHKEEYFVLQTYTFIKDETLACKLNHNTFTNKVDAEIQFRKFVNGWL